MTPRLIAWSMRNRFAVACLTIVVVAFGIRAVLTTPVDAIPDLSENQVIVFANWTGRSPQEVETQLTQPLSLNLQGLAGVKTVRATSMFGFSLITLIFADEIDSAIARQRVLERLNYLGRKLPPGVEPTLGPDATGLGWVYQYYLDAKSGYDLGESRSLQDWFIRYDGSVRFTTAPSASTQCAQRLSAVGRNVYRGHRIFFSCAHDRKQAL